MPYINKDKRAALNPHIDNLLNAMRELESDDPSNNFEGNLNYVISTLLNLVYVGGGYRSINDAMGVLSSVQAEFYRRVAVPYEENKRYSNGDVFTVEQQ